MNKNIILKPVISEKSYSLANESNMYVFLVDPKASKIEIEKEIEKQYKVKVLSVNTVVRPGKSRVDWRKNRKFRGSDMKKAIIKVKDGDKIDDFFNV